VKLFDIEEGRKSRDIVPLTVSIFEFSGDSESLSQLGWGVKELSQVICNIKWLLG
jgi:hypothetical protein